MNNKPSIVFCFLILNFNLFAQFEWPSLSPKENISQIVGNTTIKVKYERPSVRERKIFGGLVPWNKVWRTGAGYCTKISFDKDVEIENQAVSAGIYSLFTIPKENEWVVILNSDTSLYGSYDYEPTKDVARFAVKSEISNRYYEALTIDIDFIPNNARVYISWVNTSISFNIHTTTDKVVLEYINQLLLKKEKVKEPDEYGMAADYLMFNNIEYNKALKLADLMIEKKGNEGWARWIKMKIYEKQNYYKQAIIEVENALKFTQRRKYEFEKDRVNDIKLWKQRKERIIKKMNSKD